MIIFGSLAHFSAIGGVENSIRSLLYVAIQEDHPVTLVCRAELPDEALDLTSTLLPSEVEWHSYPDESHTNLLRRLLCLHVGGDRVSAIYRRLHRSSPHAKVIVRHHSHALAAHAAGFSDIRYLVPSLTVLQLSAELRGASLRQRLILLARIWIDGWAQKRALNHANLFVFSESMQCEVSRYLSVNGSQKKIRVVKPGVDPTRFYLAKEVEKVVLRAQLDLPLGKNLLLFVGRFSRGKGIDFFLQALQMLPDDYVAVLVGDGERQTFFRQQVEHDGLAARVIFTGATSRVDDYYRACNLFIMPTITEGFGQTLIEAAACGLRIVAFHRSAGVVTATHEMGLDGTIEYATELSADALAGAVLRAMKSMPDGSIDAASEYVHKSYCWDALLEQLLD